MIDSGFKGSRSITTCLCCDQSSNRSFCPVGTGAEPMFPNFSHPPRTASTSISTIGEWFSTFSRPGSLHNWQLLTPPASNLGYPSWPIPPPPGQYPHRGYTSHHQSQSGTIPTTRSPPPHTHTHTHISWVLAVLSQKKTFPASSIFCPTETL